MQVAFLWYPGAAFGSRTPPFFVCQTRKLSAIHHQWNLWLDTKHLMDMFPRFWIRWSSIFAKCSIFHPWQSFLLITLLLWMPYCLLFQGLKGHRFLKCVPNFLFTDVYLNLLFNFKSWFLVRSFLSNVVHVYYYTLIIRIIKTTCFNNTILMAELEGKLP